MSVTHWLADHNKVTQPNKILSYKHVLILRTISRYNQKTDTAAQLYCTLSMCVTPKSISHQNQITNTPPQLYCTLSSTCVCRSKPCSHQNQTLTQHNNTTRKKVPPAHAKRVSLSICLSVRAKRGIYSKRVLIRKRKRFLY